MDDGDDTDDLALYLINQPIFVDKQLATILPANFPHDASAPGQKLQTTTSSQNLLDHRRGITRRILGDVSRDPVQVVPDLW